jgi:hypothetical protein
MSLYEPLGQHLRKKGVDRVPMTFAEIETVIGRKLPKSAYRHRPWWANEERGHSHAKAWLQAGYLTEQVDMEARKLVFARMKSHERGFREGSKMFEQQPSQSAAADAPRTGQHPLVGCMKGTFTIEPGYDLTQPAMPEWADLIDEKYGPETSR